MSTSKRFTATHLLAVTALLAGFFVASIAPATTCTGTRYDYFATAACIEIVGTKVSCPGFPDEFDTAPDGSYTVTSFVITEEVVCPCPGGGGGNNGGADPDEDAPEGE